MKLGNFNLFDTISAAGIYDPTVSTSTNSSSTSNPVALAAAAYAAASSNGKPSTNHLGHSMSTNHQHHGQHMYSPGTDYSSSPVSSSNGYWPYSTQPYFPGSTRQYVVPQTPSISTSDAGSPTARHDLSYPSHGNYPHMQKMVGNYSTSYEFYQQHNAKYC